MNIYAFADEACPQMDGQIAAMHRNRLKGLEIRGVDGENIAEISLKKAREVHRMLEDAGLTVWSIGSPLGKIPITDENFQAHLDLFRHTLDLARILEAGNLRLFSFFMPKGQEPARYRDQVITRLQAFAEAAEGSGIDLCHENEKAIYGDIASRCLEIHRAVPQLKAVFDPANFVQCGQDTLEAWDLLHPYVKYMHIKDALPDGHVVPAGKGQGHVAQLLHRYQAQGGENVTVEPHLSVFDGLKALETAENTSEIGLYRYPSSDAAFDAACRALKDLLV